MRHNGVVVNWHDERGFGFVRPEEGGQDLFLHIKSFDSDVERPHDGMAVSYSSEVNAQGQLRAERVVAVGANRWQTPAAKRLGAKILGYTAVAGFAAIVALEVMFWGMPAWVVAIYGGVSIVSFAFYWQDKNAAIAGTWRVPETQLHLLGLVGGWPGGVIAQIHFRHKTKKEKFARDFWYTVLLNVLLFVAVGTIIHFNWIGRLVGMN